MDNEHESGPEFLAWAIYATPHESRLGPFEGNHPIVLGLTCLMSSANWRACSKAAAETLTMLGGAKLLRGGLV